ncbi:hypothetical protein DEFR109230_14210 [Deinococcus frigens]
MLVLVVSSCASPLPPHSPTVWGLSYAALEVPAGTLAPLSAVAGWNTVRIEAGHVNTRMVAHEVTHIWQQRHLAVPVAFLGAPCGWQPEWNCSALEAHADAVGAAAVRAGCSPGDFGWPGWEATACTIPDPLEVHP